MEVENASLSELDSFHINGKHVINVIDLNKKRKLQAEQLGLPVAKHKCWIGSSPSKSISTLDENPEVEDFHKNTITGISDTEASNDESEEGSAKDSNSFVEDSDSAMSIKGESKFEAENGTMWPYNRPSSSSLNWDNSSFKDNCYSLDNTTMIRDVGKDQFTFVHDKNHPSHYVEGLHVAESLDEPLIEYERHVEYLCSGYDKGSIKQYMDKEIEDILYSNEVNPNMYVLSSGRLSTNQDTQQGKRKPTIDQEFEQYFSTLML